MHQLYNRQQINFKSIMKKILLLCCAFYLGATAILVAQEDNQASPFDFGKMWTFENPPTEWFKEAYDMNVTEEWFEDVRMSSLRFASWCSASFVSGQGLIMTNHHCSRDVANQIQKDSENFDNDGFYAVNLTDERKVDGLFVEQMVQAKDITDEVNGMVNSAEDDLTAQRQAALAKIQAKYAEMEGWKDLRLQTVTFYSGGKFSIYGYKRYDEDRKSVV